MPSRNNTGDDLVPNDNILKGVRELNLGRSEQLFASPTPGQPGDEAKLLMVPEMPNVARPQVVTVHLAAFVQNVQGNPSGIPVGIIEFSGGGAKLGRIEFDIPIARPFPPGWDITTNARRSLNNGVSVSVPAGGFQALARNDGNIGFITNPTTGVNPGSNLVVSAHVARFPIGQGENLRRTVFVAGGGGGALAAGNAVSLGIPNYAKSVWFPRTPLAEDLEITITGVGGLSGTYIVPTNALYPAPDAQPIPISPDDFTLTIRNTGLNPISNMKAVFALEL